MADNTNEADAWQMPFHDTIDQEEVLQNVPHGDLLINFEHKILNPFNERTQELEGVDIEIQNDANQGIQRCRYRTLNE